MLADLLLVGTTEKSTLAITGKGGDGFINLPRLHADGPMSSITGKTTRLSGTASIAGSLKSITLAEAVDARLEVGAAAKATSTLALKLNSAAGFRIISETPVKSIAAQDWAGDGSDEVSAPWFKTITIKNNLNVTLIATGTDAKGLSLSTLRASSLANSSLTAPGGVKTITAGNWIGGQISAAWINTATITGDLLADIFLTGNASLPAIKRLAVRGMLRDGTLRTAGNITTIDVGSLNNFTLLVGVTPGLNRLPESAADFTATGGTITTLTVRGTANQATSFTDTLVIARTLDRVTIRETASTNGEPSGILTDSIVTYTRTTPSVSVKLSGLDAPGLHDAVGLFGLRIV